MSVVVDRQLSLDDDDADSPGAPPTLAALERLVTATLAAADGPADAELTVRVVGRGEGAELNATYRQRSGPTNVLSFPFTPPPELADQPELAAELAAGLLGDLVICAPVVVAEAAAQDKAVEAHWAHMVVHGTLHLLGHDHGDDCQAEVMEGLERRVLAELGYPDPYLNESES